MPADAGLPHTFRSDDLARSAELSEWLSSLERFLSVRRQTLTSLPFEETRQLVESLFGAERMTTGNGNEGQAEKEGDIEVWSRWLFDQTRGHPFMLVEYFKLVAERRDLLDDEAGTVRITPDLLPLKETARSTLPVRVRDLIHERFTRLSRTALTLCMAAAVLGDGFTFDQLCHVADLTDNQGLSALDEVLMRGLLQETGGRCFFAHDSIRAVAYAEAGEIRRRVLHRRAFETLQAALASPAELAYHALAAGLPDVAARLSIAAGDAAMRLFAARDAITQYEQARQLAMRSNEYLHPSREEIAVVSLDDLCQLSLQLGWAYELSSRFVQAERIYEELLNLARTWHEPVMECAALNRLATLAARTSQDPARAEELLQQALVIAESSQNIAGMAETVSNLAQTGFYAGKMSASLPHAERALALARELNKQELIGRGVALARDLEITPLLVLALNQWGNVNRAMLAMEAAHTAHSEALTLCESFMPQQDFIEWIASELCADCALGGQWQQAYMYALKALVARDYSIMHGGLARWLETEALLRGGSIEEAREDVRRFGERAHDKRRYAISYLQALAVLAQWDHEIDQAITHLEAAHVLAEQLDLPGERWQLLTVLGELYQSSKHESQAQQAFAHAAQIVHRLADGIENEQQRTTFLSAQRVRAVLEQSIADE